MLLTARGNPRAAWWMRVLASSLNSGSERAAEFQVVADVAGGLGWGHGRDRVAQGDALVERGEDAEADHPPKRGLADEQAGQRAGGVHLVVGEHPDGLELVVVEQVRLVDDEHGGAAAFAVLGGQQAGGLSDMFATTDLIGPLAQRGIRLSSSQVYRLVAERPERLSLKILMALLDILDCSMDDLIEPVTQAGPAGARKKKAAGAEAGVGDLRPRRARIHDPGPA
jgi:DNA-binding Xre family transcriptional regulator